ncbi:uncharacterized protein LOC18424163 [Amborella trichopoda]|uniref:DUF632 domain-containing protein n=1 Tax=Amborella trichopoda TaxID=13333 RepID=W1NLY7_AMBTC|nr:uncharacterized protein LOC18424163 [Amborella trichopoda]ERM96235.1 hypothetical protein AMTR_s00001p00134970 [Amborella trichopoda]|eukprot:XP_006828819.1 uncharacterized protein LOC18424163 [Amborella trichopoda]
MESESAPPPPPPLSYGWDFFNPFGSIEHELSNTRVHRRSSEDDLRVVREEEGIPDLEEDLGVVAEPPVLAVEEAVPSVLAVKEEEEEEEVVVKEKGLTVVETPARARELVESLRDVGDHFMRAYDSGKEVGRMLEATSVQYQSGLDEIKENSSKIVHAIAWHRSSSSSLSSPNKNYLESNLKDVTWGETKSDDILFIDCGMISGSHSMTLDRLYAWEKKLYHEVKAGERTRRTYEQKMSQLRNQETKGVEQRSLDKTRAIIRDLHTRIWVAIRSADSISIRIQKLRDEELHPQLTELLHGLLKTWKIMWESHQTQYQIISEVQSFSGKFCTDLHHKATLQLEIELQNWRTSFFEWVSAQKAYVKALHGWLSTFIISDLKYNSRSMPAFAPPALLVICGDWLLALEKLQDKDVGYAMKSLGREVRALWVQQGEEIQQKRKVESLAKELDRRVRALQRVENRILESKLSDSKTEGDLKHRVEYLAARKELIELFRKRLDNDKVKHLELVQETQKATVEKLRVGLMEVFEVMSEFARCSSGVYEEVLEEGEKARVAFDRYDNPSIEAGQVSSSDAG